MWKRALIIACALVVCVVILRELGIADLNLYRSVISTQHTGSHAWKHHGEKVVSREISIRYGEEIIVRDNLRHEDSPPVIIEGELEEPHYEGSYYTPLTKNFTATYHCEFEGSDEAGDHTVEGKIDLEVTARIRGLCSRVKAKELAHQSATDQVVKYFEQQFGVEPAA